jgi:hypothetical protein
MIRGPRRGTGGLSRALVPFSTRSGVMVLPLSVIVHQGPLPPGPYGTFEGRWQAGGEKGLLIAWSCEEESKRNAP